MKVVRLSAIRTSRFTPAGDIPDTHFCYRLSRPQGHSATRRIKSVQNGKTDAALRNISITRSSFM